MTVALRSPQLVSALIPVDNAPLDATLKSDFGKYVQGMKKVEEAGVTKQSEADEILKKYEDVSSTTSYLFPRTAPPFTFPVPKFSQPGANR